MTTVINNPFDATNPGPIGGTTPGSVAATTLSASGLITATGGQIKFPATQSPSSDPNTLDDYEEGTFTPVIAFGGASVGVTYSANQFGSYTKVGNIVIFSLLLQLTSKGSSVGTATLTGLPFTAAASASAIIAFNLNLGAAGVTTMTTGSVSASAATVNLQSFAAGSLANLADTSFANNSILRVSGSYQV